MGVFETGLRLQKRRNKPRDTRGSGVVLVCLAISPPRRCARGAQTALRGPTRHTTARERESGRSGRDDCFGVESKEGTSAIRENGVPGKTKKEKPKTQAQTPCLGQPSLGRERETEGKSKRVGLVGAGGFDVVDGG